MTQALATHLDSVRDELDVLEPIVHDATDGVAMRDAAVALGRTVGHLVAAIDAALIEATADLADLDGRRRILLDDGELIVEPAREKKRTDWPLLLPVLLARIVDDRFVDPSTGEIVDESVVEKMTRLLPTVCAMYPSASAKATGLRDLGIDPYQFISSERGRLTVRVER